MLRAFRRRIRWFTRGREKTRHPLSRVTLYTAGHLHTAVPNCSHSRAPIVHTAVPRENNEHGCVYLRCRAVCKLPGCVEGHPCLYSQVDERNLLACRVSCKGFSCFFYSCRYGRRSIGWNDGRNEPGPVFLLNEIFINCNVTRLKTSQKIIRICNNANIFSAEIICPFPTKSVDKVMGRRYSATCWQCPKGRC